jgi:hypothetical protein
MTTEESNPLRARLHRVTLDRHNTETTMSNQLHASIHPEWRRGDIIRIDGLEDVDGFWDYRNEGKLIFNGSAFDELGYDIDWEGHVPDVYYVGEEFPSALYWSHVIEHNGCVPVSFGLEIAQTVNALVATGGDEPRVFSFRYKDLDWTIVLCTRYSHILPFRDGEPTSLAFANSEWGLHNCQHIEEHIKNLDMFDKERTLYYTPEH